MEGITMKYDELVECKECKKFDEQENVVKGLCYACRMQKESKAIEDDELVKSKIPLIPIIKTIPLNIKLNLPERLCIICNTKFYVTTDASLKKVCNNPDCKTLKNRINSAKYMQQRRLKNEKT